MPSTCGFAAGGEDEPATLRKLGSRVSAIRFAYLAAELPECGAAPWQDLSPSDQITANSVGGGVLTRASGKAIRADLTGGQIWAKPQVTRMIGVFDPYRRGWHGRPLGSPFLRMYNSIGSMMRRSASRTAPRWLPRFTILRSGMRESIGSS
jgi:hypothetical protein